MTMQGLTTAELLSKEAPEREYMLVSGKDGVGKTTAVLTLAQWVELRVDLWPDATFYFIDTENGMRKILRGFGSTAPQNIRYFQVSDMETALAAIKAVFDNAKPGDWIAVESMARLWEYAQDHGYERTVGMSKAEYLDAEREKSPDGRIKSPIPSPDLFWQVTKNAHDRRFLNRLTNSNDLNVVLTTTIAKKRENNPRENKDRAEFREEHGIDAAMEGLPRLPYYPDTVMILEQHRGKHFCDVLKDRGASHRNKKITFEPGGPDDFAMQFWQECRS